MDAGAWQTRKVNKSQAARQQITTFVYARFGHLRADAAIPPVRQKHQGDQMQSNIQSAVSSIVSSSFVPRPASVSLNALHDVAPGRNGRGDIEPMPAIDGTTMGQWMRSMLDEIDYGMLLVNAQAQLLHVNHTAQTELDARHPLQITPQGVRTLRSQDTAPLLEALAGAQRGRRKLLLLGSGEHRVCLSVVPLPGGATLMVLGKRQVCEQLTVQGYARSMGLTAAETRVLDGLCAGVRPREIAERQGVAVSTVRTQIGSIRAKTGVASIRELVRQVAVLPPLVGALKGGGSVATLAALPVAALGLLSDAAALARHTPLAA